MFCPKCGIQNVEEVSFCRSCGLDLTTIARVMERHLPLALLEKIDEQILNPKKSEIYTSILAGLMALALFAVGFAFSGWNYPKDALYFFIGAAAAFVQSIWYFLIYIRSRSKTKMTLTTTDYLEAAGVTFEEYKNSRQPLSVIPSPPQIAPSPAEVADLKTNQLKTKTEERKTRKLKD